MNIRAAGCITLAVGLFAVAALCGPESFRSGACAGTEIPGGAGEIRAGTCPLALRELLASSRPADTIAVWIYLSDRGGAERRMAGETPCVSPRAASRRSLRGREPFDARDLPVFQGYIDSLRGHVARFRHASRYFNAVSAEVQASEIPAVCGHDFVKSVDRIGAYRRLPDPPGYPARAASSASLNPDSHLSLYGGSFDQLNQVGVIELLEKGYNGSGTVSGSPAILIAILDTGFKLDHEALADVQVEAQWDFVQGDSVTANQTGDSPDQDMHGTTVLGVIAGRSEGSLIGPAWGARYLLAKTEIRDEEIRIEEDHWVAGIEWADSAGADVVTSSLGYIDWYTQSSLDGNTALCTRAADIAVSHGIVVVNSAGNQGLAGLVAPADGDSVLAIGAVDESGAIAYFSSRGPTADGRVKPDFVAMGLGVQSVSYADPFGFAAYNGTSFAAPIAAGVCALLLERHPEWDPVDVRTALRATSSKSGFPDDTYGWGIPDAALASRYPESFASPAAFPNPFSAETRLSLSLAAPGPMTVRVYNCAGALVRTLAEGSAVQRSLTLTWDGTDERGTRVAGGVYFLRIDSRTLTRTVKLILIR